MDLIIVLLIASVTGLYRVYKINGFETVQISGNSNIVRNANVAEIPVGNNLYLYKEPDAFTYILKELELV